MHEIAYGKRDMGVAWANSVSPPKENSQLETWFVQDFFTFIYTVISCETLYDSGVKFRSVAVRVRSKFEIQVGHSN